MIPRMMDPHRLLAFCTMSLFLSAIPGPSVLFVIGRALAHGRRTALASVLGNALGGYALVIAVALGIGALVESSVLVFNTIKLAGAAYLIYLGVKALRASWKSRAEAASLTPVPSSGRGSVWAGFLVGVNESEERRVPHRGAAPVRRQGGRSCQCSDAATRLGWCRVGSDL
jgi:threonine/homoserine/homoserine lactone efflux protein